MTGKARKEKKAKGRGNGRGTVYQEGKKWRWTATIGHRPDGTRISRGGTCATRTEAETALSALLTDLDRGLVSPSDGITVAEYAEKWLKRQHGVIEKTRNRYKELLAYPLKHLGSLKLREVRAHHINDTMAALAEQKMASRRPMSPRTLIHVRVRLRALFRAAVADGLLYANPAEGMKAQKIKAPRTAGEVFDEGQVQRFAAIGWALYDAGLSRLFPALFLTVSTGLRREEVVGLKWAQVDLDRGVLKVREVITGGVKGNVTKEPKTKSSVRDLPLPESLKGVLAEVKRRQDEEREEAGEHWEGQGHVFTTGLGKHIEPLHLNRALAQLIRWSDPAQFPTMARHLSKATPVQALARLKAEVMAGDALPSRSPHDLRHTYGTLALRRGVPVEVVSKLLGHSTVSMTLDVYRHVLDDEKRLHVVDLFQGYSRAQPAPVAPN